MTERFILAKGETSWDKGDDPECPDVESYWLGTVNLIWFQSDCSRKPGLRLYQQQQQQQIFSKLLSTNE